MTAFAYDVAGRTDAAGRRIRDINGENESTRYFYDLTGNVARRRSHLNRETLYEYDAHGRKTREQDAIGGVMTWGYDYSCWGEAFPSMASCR